MMHFGKDYFEKYGQYRSDVKEVKQFRKFIFSSKRILWVGCSTGKGVKYLNDRNIDCIGVDINDYAILMSRIASKLLKADILDLPFKDGEFDCVICIDLLEHLTEKQMAKALSELKRVSSDKIIVGVTPKGRKAFYADQTHVTALSFDEWEKLLDSQLPERIASDFYDARYVFSKKAKPNWSPFSVEVHCRIADVHLSSFTWADSTFSQEKLRFIENADSCNAVPQYIIVKKYDKTIAFCPFFIFGNEKFATDKGALVFEKYRQIVRKIKFCFDKSIVAYSPFAYDSEMLSKKDYGNVVKLICQKINEICQKGYIDVSAFLCLCKDDRETLNIIKKQGYRELELHPNTKLTNGFNSFHKYLSLLSGIYRKCEGDVMGAISSFEDNSDSHQMKTESGDKPAVKVALLKFRTWKARGVMNAYISLLKRFYQAKMVLQGKV
jgi:SAM-dependent methyltransferase